MQFCNTYDEETFKKYYDILQEIQSLSDIAILRQMNTSENRPDWLSDPTRWSSGIANLKSELTIQIEASNPSEMLTSCKISNGLWMSAPPIIFLLGTIGNLLSFIVLCHPSMSQISSYVYLATLAVVDESVLIFGLLRQWIDRLIGRRIEDISSVTCKLSQIVGISSSCLSVWLIVALTVERVIVITFPLQANRFASPSRAKVIIALLALLFTIICLHFIETVDLVISQKYKSLTSNSTLLTCEFKNKYHFFGRAWTVVDATFYSYAPLLLISIMNTIILFQVYKARRSRRSLFHNQHHHSVQRSSLRAITIAGGCSNNAGINSTNCSTRTSEGSRQLTIMLFVISCSFMVTTAPIVILKFLNRVKLEGPSSKGKFELADTVGTILMYFNHAMNFFLYCATGNKFRQQLKRIICGRRCLQTNITNNSCQYNSNYNARFQVRRSTRTSALTSSDEAVELRNLLPSHLNKPRLNY